MGIQLPPSTPQPKEELSSLIKNKAKGIQNVEFMDVANTLKNEMEIVEKRYNSNTKTIDTTALRMAIHNKHQDVIKFLIPVSDPQGISSDPPSNSDEFHRFTHDLWEKKRSILYGNKNVSQHDVLKGNEDGGEGDDCTSYSLAEVVAKRRAESYGNRNKSSSEIDQMKKNFLG